MKTQPVFLAFLGIIILGACTVEPDHSNWAEPDFKVTISNQEDAVSITSEEGMSLIEINSPSGIGSAHFEIVSGTLPETIIARLHLKGLEEFRLSYDETMISASISSSSALNISNQKIVLSNVEYPILPSDPLWLEIEIISDQAIKKIPLEEDISKLRFPGRPAGKLEIPSISSGLTFTGEQRR